MMPMMMIKKKMGQKHLHELLEEDQEPFVLNSYVADRSFGAVGTKHRVVNTQQLMKLKKQRPGSRNSILTGNIRKGSCFSSSYGSPDNRRSCPARFNVQTPGSVVSIQVPPKTAALLLQAALRIQNSPPRNQDRLSGGIPGFRLFGSLLKRLTSRNLTDKLKRMRDGEWHCCSTPGFEPTNSSFIGITEEVGLKPQSGSRGFRFLLQRVIHSGRYLPEVTSATTYSPIRLASKDNGRSDQDSLTKLMVDEEEEEEEKEQCSPVCVLYPLFEDEEDEDAQGHHQNRSDECFDYENSFAVVQKAKRELLEKLYRVEKLAELDPTELEKFLIDKDSEEDGEINEPECAGFLFEMCYQEQENIPIATKMTRKCCSEEQDTVMTGLCKRLQLWKEADFDKIDMMVERDLSGDHNGWIKTDQEQVIEAAKDIEVAIFGMMLQQLTEDLQ